MGLTILSISSIRRVVNTKLIPILSFLFAGVMTASAQNRITLPIEVMGGDGATQGVGVSLSARERATNVRALWMQIHGLEYADEVSVRVNGGEWVALNNKTVAVGEPGKSYGGIGGAVSTLKVTLGLAEGAVVPGANRIEFRFNHTDGVVSGFRVLAFHFLNAEGQAAATDDTFAEEDPNTWTAPLRDAESVTAGRRLWREGALVANGLPGAGPIRAHCGDCHARDGRDLKYFNFSNAAIVTRSRFHGLSEKQGQEIASYIRSLDMPSPGRPWNPPYQPGPGLDKRPVENWAAGAGLQWVLDNDVDTLPYVFGKTITAASFAPDGHLNAREIPIGFPLPDWNHWLPRVHPMDVWGARFDKSDFARMYDGGDYQELSRSFDKWTKARAQVMTPRLAVGSKKWTPELAANFYAAELWQLVKTWEVTEELGLEREARTWPNVMAAETAPASANIPDGVNGMFGSALANEYFNNAWYELQTVVNSGSHQRHGKGPVDWTYVAGRYLDLEKVSGRAEPGRLTIAVIEGMQASDVRIGPENIAEGWRPEQGIDPRIMVEQEWVPMFAPLSAEMKRQMTEALLTAWLDKTLRYPVGAYFQLGLTASSYQRPKDLQAVAGGRVWEAADEFRAAGVDEKTVEKLREWGKAYMSLAGLFHY